MSDAPRIIDHLVNLTALRDIELLNFSLLKTIAEMTTCRESFLVNVDGMDRARAIVRYQPGGGHGMANGDIQLDPDELGAMQMVQKQRAPYQARRPDGSFLCVLPVIEQRMISTYLFCCGEQPVSATELRVARGLARIYSNFCTLLEESQRDQLTGLLNRKTFDEGIDRLAAMTHYKVAQMRSESQERRHGGEQSGYWFGMIDIDHFKRINDSYGHLYGDEVLLLLAQLMRRTFREGDLLFRFGGEEFVAVTSNIGRDSARIAFERFRKVVAEYEFPQVGHITVSVGVTEVGAGAPTPLLIDRADSALYYAKRHGRNQVVFHEDLIERGEIKPPEMVGSIDLF